MKYPRIICNKLNDTVFLSRADGVIVFIQIGVGFSTKINPVCCNPHIRTRAQGCKCGVNQSSFLHSAFLTLSKIVACNTSASVELQARVSSQVLLHLFNWAGDLFSVARLAIHR